MVQSCCSNAVELSYHTSLPHCWHSGAMYALRTIEDLLLAVLWCCGRL